MLVTEIGQYSQSSRLDIHVNSMGIVYDRMNLGYPGIVLHSIYNAYVQL